MTVLWTPGWAGRGAWFVRHCELFVFLWPWKGSLLSQSRSAEQSKGWLSTQAEPTADVTHSYLGCQFVLTWIALSCKSFFFFSVFILLKCQKAQGRCIKASIIEQPRLERASDDHLAHPSEEQGA